MIVLVLGVSSTLSANVNQYARYFEKNKKHYDKKYRSLPYVKIKRKSQQIKDYYSRKDRFIKDPAKYLCAVAKVRAKQQGIIFDLNPDDIKIPVYCPLSGNLLVKGNGYDPNAMSLDRLIPSNGYVRGNVFVISRLWNLRKSNMTVDDLQNIINYIKERLNE